MDIRTCHEDRAESPPVMQKNASLEVVVPQRYLRCLVPGVPRRLCSGRLTCIVYVHCHGRPEISRGSGTPGVRAWGLRQTIKKEHKLLHRVVRYTIARILAVGQTFATLPTLRRDRPQNLERSPPAGHSTK